MTCLDDGSEVLISPKPGTSSNHGSPVHALCCRTHICVHIHAWLMAQVSVKKVCCVCMSHISDSPSPLSWFIRRPCCSRTVTSTPRSRPHRLRRALPDPKARVKRTSARAPRSLVTWPIPRTSHLLMVPALISTECVPAHSMHSSKSSEICCFTTRRECCQLRKPHPDHRQLLVSFSHPGLPTLNRSSVPLLPRWPHSQKWNKTSSPSRHAYARLKQAQLPPLAVPVRQALGIGQSDGSTATGSLGSHGP